jgi:hypothetical protein
MKVKDPSLYIRAMIQEFRLPGKDCMTECMFTPDEHTVWDSGVFTSTCQSELFYTDIFQFWVRALFCFSEEMADHFLFQSVAPLIACRQIPPKEFERNLLALVHQHMADKSHREMESFSESYTELQKCSFSDSYVVLNGPDVESSVAESGGEYIAYFHRTKGCPLSARPRTPP